MCLETVMTNKKQVKYLKTVPDPVICWKTVHIDNKGILHPLYCYTTQDYFAGINVIHRKTQYISIGTNSKLRIMLLGAHFFRHRCDAVAVARYHRYNRRVVRCKIAKKDIDAIGETSMTAYPITEIHALTIVAHRATFAKTIRKVS